MTNANNIAKRRLSTTINANLDERITKALEGTDISRAQFVRRALEMYLASEDSHNNKTIFKRVV